jgi:hypothetical protein
MRWRFSAIKESDNVRVLQSLEDFDLAIEVFFELLV